MTTNLRYVELWEAVRMRLYTTRMATLLGPGKVYLEGEDYSKTEGPEGSFWGRLVIVPAVTLWPSMSGMAPTRNVAFLTRAEISNYKSLTFNPQINLDAIQEECEDQLVGYHPEGMSRITCALPIYLASGAQPRPLWDDLRGLHWTSAQYRLEVAKR